MRWAFLLALSVIVLPLVAKPVGTPVAVVLVNARTISVADVQPALRYWNEHAPDRPNLFVDTVRFVEIADPHASYQWMWGYVDPHRLTLIAVDTCEKIHLGGGIWSNGWASMTHRWGYATRCYGPLPALAPVLAHEIGHALYCLPDALPGYGLSIMANAPDAFRRWQMHPGDVARIQRNEPCPRVNTTEMAL